MVSPPSSCRDDLYAACVEIDPFDAAVQPAEVARLRDIQRAADGETFVAPNGFAGELMSPISWSVPVSITAKFHCAGAGYG